MFYWFRETSCKTSIQCHSPQEVDIYNLRTRPLTDIGQELIIEMLLQSTDCDLFQTVEPWTMFSISEHKDFVHCCIENTSVYDIACWEEFIFEKCPTFFVFWSTSKFSFKALEMNNVIKNNKFRLSLLFLFSWGKFKECKKDHGQPYMLFYY